MSSSLAFPATMRQAAVLGLQQHGSPLHHALTLLQQSTPRAARAVRCCASRPDHYGGALVDEGMPALRRRIWEVRMLETNYKTPPGWAAWEKCCYPASVSDVSARAGTLQLMAMATKPGVAVAVATLVLAGVPVSAAVALHLLGQAAGAILQHVS